MNIREFVKDSLHKYYIKLKDFFPGKSEVNASNEVTATALIKLQDRLLKLESAQNYTGFLSYLHSNGKVDYNAASDVIGICVIPKSHFGKARFMSVVNMSANTTSGTTSNEYLKWDSRSTPTTVLSKQYTNVGLSISGTILITENFADSNFTVGRGNLPTDKLHGGYEEGHHQVIDLSGKGFDNETKYWYDEYDGGLEGYSYIMSPFKIDGSLNPLYHPTADVALSDINGAANTATIIAAGNTFPAAQACHDFEPGFKDNEWYLPAMGELGYLIVRWGAINEKLAELEDAGCSIAYLPELVGLWSSSEFSGGSAWGLDANDGYADGNNKGYNGILVRAFLALDF